MDSTRWIDAMDRTRATTAQVPKPVPGKHSNDPQGLLSTAYSYREATLSVSVA